METFIIALIWLMIILGVPLIGTVTILFSALLLYGLVLFLRWLLKPPQCEICDCADATLEVNGMFMCIACYHNTNWPDFRGTPRMLK